MKNPTIKVFDKHAVNYDELQQTLVPGYDDVISMVAEAYLHYIGEGTFLDMGCGTGNVSLKILKESPKSRVFLLDGSLAMLKIALQKVKAEAGGQVICGSKAVNLETKDWHQGIEGPFDGIVTAFVLEHLQEDDYRAVVRKNHELLREGGVFITVEWSDDEYGMQEWFMKKMKRRGDAIPEYAPVIEEFTKSEKHYFVNIREKIGWLKDAGFQNVHPIWQHLFGYIVVCEK